MKGLSSSPPGASPSLGLDFQMLQPDQACLCHPQAVHTQTQRHIRTSVWYFSMSLSDVCYVKS